MEIELAAFIILVLIIAGLFLLFIMLIKQAYPDQRSQEDKNVLEHTEFFTKEAQQKLNHVLQETITRISSKNKEYTEKILHDYKQVASFTSDTARVKTEQALESVTQETKNKLNSVLTQIDELASEEYKQIRSDLTAFKEKKVAEIENQLNKQVPALVKEIVGKSIPTAEHEKLIKKALEKASQEILLS